MFRWGGAGQISTAQGILPDVPDTFIAKDDFFGPLLAKNVQFLAIDRGYESMLAILRGRRIANERMQKLREAVIAGTREKLDALDDEDFDETEAEEALHHDLY